MFSGNYGSATEGVVAVRLCMLVIRSHRDVVSISRRSLLILLPLFNKMLLGPLLGSLSLPRCMKRSSGTGASFSTCTRKNSPCMTLYHLMGMVIADTAHTCGTPGSLYFCNMTL